MIHGSSHRPIHAPSSSTPAEPAEPSKSTPDAPFAHVLAGLGHEIDRGEAVVQRAMSGIGRGKDLGGLELLALQASVYRYSEAVDLAAKLVDRTSSGVKTVIQGQ